MRAFESELDYDVPFGATTDAMAIVDASDARWNVRSINESFEVAFDCREADVRGRPLQEVLDLDFDVDRRFRSRIRAGVGGETYVELDDAEYFFRVRPFDTPDARIRSLVVITDSPGVDRAHEEVLPAELFRGVAAVVRADDPAEARDATADLLLETLEFDAFVAELGEVSRLENVDAPIPVDSSGRARGQVRHGVNDPGNDEVWDTVVQQPVDDRGFVQVAARDDTTIDPRTVEWVELVCEHLGAVLDGMDREPPADDRAELELFNRILRHSMLNGLHLVRARLDLIESDVGDDTRDHYETVRARIDDMIDRIEAIRAIRAEEPPETDARPLAPLVEERVERAREKNPDASFSVVGPVPDVAVDVDELVHFTLRNVLGNSVRHADVETPEVRITAERADDVATVRIADNGPGIPTDIEESIFGEGVSSLDGDGHGVGLFLTRKIVEDRYGGTVRAEETDRGGAEFVLELPVADE